MLEACLSTRWYYIEPLQYHYATTRPINTVICKMQHIVVRSMARSILRIMTEYFITTVNINSSHRRRLTVFLVPVDRILANVQCIHWYRAYVYGNSSKYRPRTISQQQPEVVIISPFLIYRWFFPLVHCQKIFLSFFTIKICAVIYQQLFETGNINPTRHDATTANHGAASDAFGTPRSDSEKAEVRPAG